MVIRTKVTNQRVRTRLRAVRDVEDTKRDTVVDTMCLREGKATKESVTKSYLTKTIMLSLSLSLRTILRIVLVTISMPFIGRRATTRLTTGNIRGSS